MLFKKIFLVLICFGILSIYAKKTKLKIATIAPKSALWGKMLTRINKKIYRQTDKKIYFNVFYGGTQGDEKQAVEKIKLGSLDGGFFTSNGIGFVCEEARILDVPFLFKNDKERKIVFKEGVKILSPYFEKNGFSLLGLMNIGRVYFFSKQKINSLEKIRESKMWLWKGDKIVGKFMDIFNIPAVPVSFVEVIPSLQSGLIDGVYCTPSALISLQWHNYMNYVLDYPISSSVSSGLVISSKKWQKISSKYKKIILKITEEELAKTEKIALQSDDKTLKLLKKKNIQFLALNEKNLMQQYRGEIKENIEKKFFPEELYKKIESVKSNNN